MNTLPMTAPRITGATASTVAADVARTASSVAEHSLDKREVASSILAPCTEPLKERWRLQHTPSNEGCPLGGAGTPNPGSVGPIPSHPAMLSHATGCRDRFTRCLA